MTPERFNADNLEESARRKARQYRQRAEQMKALATDAKDLTAKKQLLAVVEDYIAMAAIIERTFPDPNSAMAANPDGKAEDPPVPSVANSQIKLR